MFRLFCQQDTGFPIEQEIRQIFLQRARDAAGREKYGTKERTRMDMEAKLWRPYISGNSMRGLSKLRKVTARDKTEIHSKVAAE